MRTADVPGPGDTRHLALIQPSHCLPGASPVFIAPQCLVRLRERATVARRSSSRAARVARASPSALMPVTSFWTRCGAAAHACPVVSVHSRNLVSCSGIPHAGHVIGTSTIYGCADRRDALTPGQQKSPGMRAAGSEARCTLAAQPCRFNIFPALSPFHPRRVSL